MNSFKNEANFVEGPQKVLNAMKIYKVITAVINYKERSSVILIACILLLTGMAQYFF
jgi:hypothetical protein